MTVAELREQVCALHAELPRAGLVAWTSGNLSARVPGEDRMVIKPSGVAYEELTIKRPLGIGGLDDPPTFLFQYRPGPVTLATLVALGGSAFRLVVSEGEILDTGELPALEMPYGNFRPATGVRACMNAWLRAGGPHHQVLNLGHRAADWEVFCELSGIEPVLV